MVYQKELSVRTDQRTALDITELVASAVRESGIRTGIVLVQTVTRATGVLCAARDACVLTDLRREMRNLVPARINYANEISPEEAAGCVKAALFGTSAGCIVKDGALLGGEETGVYFMDYDGPRDCVCSVCVTGGQEA